MFAISFAGFLFLGLILFVTLFYNLIPGVYPRGYKFIPPKLPKLDLTADAEYVADLVNVNMWLQMCNSAVYCNAMPA